MGKIFVFQQNPKKAFEYWFSIGQKKDAHRRRCGKSLKVLEYFLYIKAKKWSATYVKSLIKHLNVHWKSLLKRKLKSQLAEEKQFLTFFSFQWWKGNRKLSRWSVSFFVCVRHDVGLKVITLIAKFLCSPKRIIGNLALWAWIEKVKSQ